MVVGVRRERDSMLKFEGLFKGDTAGCDRIKTEMSCQKEHGGDCDIKVF